MITRRKLLRAVSEELDFDLRKIAISVVSAVLPQHSFGRVRTRLLRALGLRIGAATGVAGRLKITGRGSIRETLSFGSRCHVTGPLHIDLMAPVKIGSGVYFGYEVMLLTADHEIAAPAQRCGPMIAGAIEIEDGSWLGSRVIVLPGVHIGKGAVVAAGALVTKSVAANTMVGGVPATLLRRLDEERGLDEGGASPRSATRSLHRARSAGKE